MKIQLESGAGRNIIRSYTAGRITVNQEVFTGSLIVTPDRIIGDWRPRAFADLTAADFDTISRLNPEVVLLGTGARLQFPAPALTRVMVVANIGFEVMDTGAACRTYNVLMAEGRTVVAALLPIE
ncbi:MAG: Mth938-like domain-containing protein [Sulfurifustis sp.]